MCHLEALPGDPHYDPKRGMRGVVDSALRDAEALQNGGVDALMFSNERSLPYLTRVEPITSIAMSAIITEIKPMLRIPFGVNVLWDPVASVDVAVATGAKFVREIFTGVYASDFGLWNTNCGEVIRHKCAIHGDELKLLFNILPEACQYLAGREITEIARSTVFNAMPDALCISGLTAGVEPSADTVRRVKEAVGDVPVFANTGVRVSNVRTHLSVADGAIIGTDFKRDGRVWNEVDEQRVRELMDCVKETRRTAEES
jgi:membrane complex biogenesis BtpA family protein